MISVDDLCGGHTHLLRGLWKIVLCSFDWFPIIMFKPSVSIRLLQYSITFRCLLSYFTWISMESSHSSCVDNLFNRRDSNIYKRRKISNFRHVYECEWLSPIVRRTQWQRQRERHDWNAIWRRDFIGNTRHKSQLLNVDDLNGQNLWWY